MAAVLKQVFRMRLLKIAAADLPARNLRRDRQNRHAASMAIIETVDEVKISRPAASGADRQFARQVCLGAGGEGCRFFMPNMHPLNALALAHTIGETVQRIA